jgi:hypothetical protein
MAEKRYAACKVCGREMVVGGCCSATHVQGVDGTYYARTRHSGEEACGDCNAGDGQLHHGSCDLERCPICDGQLLSCDCWSHTVTVTEE